MSQRTRHTLLAALMLAAGHAHAADFFIRHQGTVAASTMAGIAAGQPYAITLVLNNDDDNTLDQTWNRYHVQCVLIQTPSAGFAQPLNNLVLPTPDGTGNVATSPAGVLTSVFSNLDTWADNGNPNRPYTHVGLGGLTAPLDWTLDGSASYLLRDDAGLQFSATGGAAQTPAQWSNPAPYDDGCTASALPPVPGPQPTPVPTLGEWGVLLLTMGLGLAGLRRAPVRHRPLPKAE